jgi:hypothetical protein
MPINDSRRDEDTTAVCAMSLPVFELYDQLHQESASLPAFIDKRGQIVAGSMT